MDAFELLKADHQKVSDLFDRIESASGQNKIQLFKQLKTELDAHALVEEKIFYPALENKQESRDITLEAYEEHKVVKDLLAQLAEVSKPNDEWDAQLKVLRENVDHHVEEEEGELFDKAGDVLGDEQIEQLGDRMAAEKAKQLGQKAPAKAARATAAAKESDSPGVLKRIANLVGLGGTDGAEDRPRAKKTGKSAGGTRKKTAGKATKKATAPGSKKPAKKASKKAGKKASNARTTSKSRTASVSSRTSAATKRAGSRGNSSKRRASTTKRSQAK